MKAFGPSARNDPAYIQQLAAAVAELQRLQLSAIAKPTTNYIANTPNEVILASAAGGAMSVSLPKVKAFYGQTIFVKKIDATGNAVTLQPKAGETIDGATSKSIGTQYMSYTVMSTGTEWVIV